MVLTESDDAIAANTLSESITQATLLSDTLQQNNSKLQRKLSAFLYAQQENNNSVVPKPFPSSSEKDVALKNGSSIANEKRYYENLDSLNHTQTHTSLLKKQYDRIATELKIKVDEKEVKVIEIYESFLRFKREVAGNAESMRTGRTLSKRVIRDMENNELKKDQEIEKVRLKFIHLRTKVKRLEQHLHAKEQLAEGLHLIDFEQLKFENQTLSEKIEERTEELTKLRKKTTSTAQVLTHVKEKLHFVLVENQKLKKEIGQLNALIKANRENLARSKKEREAKRNHLKQLREEDGVLSSDALIQEYNKRQIEHTELEIQLSNSRKRLAFLMHLLAPTMDSNFEKM
uniref:Uncharacterized protein AlNc14C221G9114 n=1 Tax=Albugo laibachii Nc14 TaxID=890382 RepID=F0WRX2_9STRA|nr:conserved unknown protein putative [Albugo laibachii Nc14]|eukprot:CCA24088.1 conserved unknown protein putative [Albugo laibachii Nc14]